MCSRRWDNNLRQPGATAPFRVLRRPAYFALFLRPERMKETLFSRDYLRPICNGALDFAVLMQTLRKTPTSAGIAHGIIQNSTAPMKNNTRLAAVLALACAPFTISPA